jgi:toxin ParE1/3/4
MKLPVKLIEFAVQDIEEVHAFISDREGQQRADKILDGLEQVVRRLSETSSHGHGLPELRCLGFKDILEFHFKPYRIVYKVSTKSVLILVVADGRRDLQELLEKRTLR